MKKFLSSILSVAMILSMCVTANAADKFKDAKACTFGTAVTGTISPSVKEETYKFDLATSSIVSVDLSAEIFRLGMNICDRNGKEIWTDKQTANDTTKAIDYKKNLALCKGTYYFSVTRNSGDGEYSLTLNQTPVNETFAEEQGGSNNTPKAASPISIGTSYTGCIALNDDTDVYKFEVETAGVLVMNVTAGIDKLRLRICDENDKESWNDRPTCDAETKRITYSKEIFLNKGKYNFYVTKNEGEGDYTFDLKFYQKEETFEEAQGGSNNDTDEASVISMNQKYKGIIASNDNIDVYEITTSKQEIEFEFTSEIKGLQLKLHDKSGKVIWWDKAGTDTKINKPVYAHKMKADIGKYFFSIEKIEGEGEYSFYFTDGGMISDAARPGSVITVRVNGRNVTFDQPPIIEEGRTLVPLRAIFEALGAEVQWDQATQTVTSKKETNEVKLQIGSNKLYKNGAERTLDVPAKIVGGRTLVPVRAVAEAYDCDVNWDDKSRTVIINNK